MTGHHLGEIARKGDTVKVTNLMSIQTSQSLINSIGGVDHVTMTGHVRTGMGHRS
jgi:hypothetical protein